MDFAHYDDVISIDLHWWRLDDEQWWWGQALAEPVVWYVCGKGQGWGCLLVFNFLLPGRSLPPWG
ncbi:hypothetical protein PRBEI_2001744100 [Prionailurus iriomotensis]